MTPIFGWTISLRALLVVSNIQSKENHVHCFSCSHLSPLCPHSDHEINDSVQLMWIKRKPPRVFYWGEDISQRSKLTAVGRWHRLYQLIFAQILIRRAFYLHHEGHWGQSHSLKSHACVPRSDVDSIMQAIKLICISDQSCVGQTQQATESIKSPVILAIIASHHKWKDQSSLLNPHVFVLSI